MPQYAKLAKDPEMPVGSPSCRGIAACARLFPQPCGAAVHPFSCFPISEQAKSWPSDRCQDYNV